MTDSSRSLSRRMFLASTATTGLIGATGRVAAQATHTVDMTDSLAFEPTTTTIAPGDTVVWENVGQAGHTVTAYADDIPGDATYFASGDFDAEQTARDAYPEGEIAGSQSFRHTFEVSGTYEYFCIPHESAGMTGTVVVEPTDGGSTPGGSRPVIPKNPLTGAVLAGLLLVVAAITWFKVFVEGVE